QREGYITLSYGNLSEKIEVIQQGTNFQLEQTQVEFVGEDWETMYGKAINFTCADLTLSRMGVEYASDADKWVSVSFNSGSNYQNYITVLPKANPNETDRVAKLKLVYYNSDKTNYYELATLTVKQKGRVYNDYEIFFDRNSNNYSIILPLKEGTEISSTESWCTATPSGDNLVIRATASTEDRSAIISFSNISCKIYVSQSKYAVGDAYSENGVEGKVTIMNNGKGSVYKEVGAHEWSTEFVTLSDVMDYDDGKVNTEAIKKIPDWETLYPAFAAVNQLNTGDVTGWYLHAVNQFKGTNFVSSDYYWSSTSSGSNNAMTVRNRNAYAVAKSSILWVLAFHDFDYNFHKK
ncbi:MAG: BACON domain-containing carbohydrate-binding protein, partial [Bacteroidales bacterium]|nr:BACON domain-containing carbohydrate-binding protein [Bacteroidales bacterium]